MLVAALRNRGSFASRPLPTLDFRAHRIPEFIVDDPLVGQPNPQPFALVAQAITPLPLIRVRIAAPLPALPYKLAAVERIIEDADELLGVASNSGSIPLAPAGAGYPFLIELLSDRD
ncbi:hypothetical protein SH593_12340 [Sphingosinicella sp. LY1275]|nr:hypothetical protein [Sphingosinicella sp. LY1275]MEA1015342.1 hypothetical protein [Sphingosinicella sp. LY1275]